MARNYSSITEARTLGANVPETGTNSDRVTLSPDNTGFPTVPFVLVLNPDTANEEAVLATSLVSGSTYAVTRNIEGGGVKTHTSGQAVKHMIVASDLQIVHDHFSNTTTAHGVTGAVVGTTNTQTLENKRLTSPKLNENIAVTATATEVNILDGATLSTSELNKLDGVAGAVVGTTDTQVLTNKSIDLTNNTLTGTKAQFNTAMTDAEFATIDGAETLINKRLTTPKINEDVTLTATATELNVLDGITSTTAELNILDGVTANKDELNILDGATLTTVELNYVDGVTSAIQTQINTIVPTGSMTMYINSTAPTGWLICDGSEQPIASYGALATLIGTNYGALTNGSGAVGTTHFRLPDLRGRIPLGLGTGRNIANSANLTARSFASGTFSKISDAETQTLTEANLPAHDHSMSFIARTTTAETHDHEGGTGNFSAPPDDRAGAAEGDITVTKNTATAGSGTAHNNMQPSTVVNFIIKH